MKQLKLKQVFLAAAVAAFPLTAAAELRPVTDAEMAAITGQDGLTIDASLDLRIDEVRLTDADGYGGSGTAGALILGGITFNDGADGAVEVSGMTIDSDGSRGLVIGLPEITGTITVESMGLGTETSIGSLAVSGLRMGGSTISIRGH